MSSVEIEKNNPGYDTGEPANKRIAFVVLLSAAILIGLIPVFNSYFNYMFEKEKSAEDKRGHEGVETRSAIEEAQRERLGKAPVSLEDAKRQLSGGDRSAVTPKSSDDLGALVGWGLDPNEAALEAATAARERAAGAGEEGEGAEDGEGAEEAAEGADGGEAAESGDDAEAADAE